MIDLASRIDASGGPTACHPWMGARSAQGYGTCTVDGRTRNAHAVVFETTRPRPPRGHVVRHMCAERSTRRIDGTARGDRLCCNERHLEVGSQSDNAKDRERARRLEARRAKPARPGRHW